MRPQTAGFILLFVLIITRASGQNPFFSNAQQDSVLFVETMREVASLINRTDPDFELAKNKAKAARRLARGEYQKLKIVDEMIDSIAEKSIQAQFRKEREQANLYRAQRDSIQSALELVELGKITQQRLANALKKAFESQDEVDRDNFYLGMQKAYEAQLILDSSRIHDEFVARTLADAGYYYYKRKGNERFLKDGFMAGVISPTGDRIVHLSRGRQAAVYRLASSGDLQFDPNFKIERNGHFSFGAFSEGGQWFVAGFRDGGIEVWNMLVNTMSRLSGHRSSVNYAAFSKDGKTLVSGSRDGTAIIWEWNGKTWKIVKRLKVGSNVREVAFAKDGKFMTRSADHIIRVWSGSGELMHELRHEAKVYSMCFSPDGKFILTASADNLAQLWATDTGKSVARLGEHKGGVLSAVFSHDGRLVLTCSADSTAMLWNLRGERLSVIPGKGTFISSGAFSQNGQYALIISGKAVTVWNIRRNQLEGVLINHTGKIHSAVFSPDGQMILTASQDGTAKLWTLQGEVLMSMDRLGRPALEAGFLTPDSGEDLVAIFTADSSITTCYLPEYARQKFKEEEEARLSESR